MKTLKKFEFRDRPGASSEYDWDKLLDGKIYELTSGEDYKCKDQTFATLCRTAAKRRGLTVKVSKVETGTVIQAAGHDSEAHQSYLAGDSAGGDEGSEAESE